MRSRPLSAASVSYAAAERARPSPRCVDRVTLAKDLQSFALRPPNQHLRAMWPHELRRAEPAAVYPEFNGGWACDECDTRDGAVLYHCFKTHKRDLCGHCLALGFGFSNNLEDDPDDEPLPDLDASLHHEALPRPTTSDRQRPRSSMWRRPVSAARCQVSRRNTTGFIAHELE